jgi:hypothetical protein
MGASPLTSGGSTLNVEIWPYSHGPGVGQFTMVSVYVSYPTG